MSRRLTQEEWIAKARAVHGDKYDYSAVVYVDSKSKVKIKCLGCGRVFEQTPSDHYCGCGCNRCGIERRANSHRLTQDEWIGKARAVHGDRYDYSLVEYVDSKSKVKIKCLGCGRVFEQKPHDHASGYGCIKCGGTARLTTDEWIAKAVATHGYQYDYSGVVYVNSATKVKIRCLGCGRVFEQLPNSHTSGGKGCQKCGGTARLTTDEWIAKAVATHGYQYDYSGVVYVNRVTKVEIRCFCCGRVFEQDPNSHTNAGKGCQKCAGLARLTTDEWIAKAVATHGYQYDYSGVVYVNSTTKVEIRCLTCGQVFEQTPISHANGRGCPMCKESRGERVVSMVLDSLAVIYERQKKFDGCKYKNRLPFDFYLPDHNTCIEYHGRQHYESVDHFGGEKELKTRQRRDRVKAKYCKEYGITLEVIPYWFDEEQVRSIVSRIAHIQLSLL